MFSDEKEFENKRDEFFQIMGFSQERYSTREMRFPEERQGCRSLNCHNDGGQVHLQMMMIIGCNGEDW